MRTCVLTLIILLCGFTAHGERPSQAELDAIFRHPEAAKVFKENPEFYVFASMDQLPKDLAWEDGSDQKPFADPRATIGGTLHTWIPSWPPTLRTTGPNSNHWFRNYLLDQNSVGLVEEHPLTRRYIPGLARRWAVSPDKMTAYYELDPDARFTDGQPITVDDFMFMFYFYRSKHIVAPWYNNWYGTQYARITRYDDYTMSITLAKPKPDPLYYSNLQPTPRNFFKDFGPDFVTRYQWSFAPKTGPFEVLSENVLKDVSITLTRVKPWWADEKPFYKHRYNPAAKEYRLIRDPNKAFEIFKKGELDMYGMSLPKYWYDKADAPEFHKGFIHKAVFFNDIPRSTWGFYINTAMPLLDNHDIRVGIQHATDWDRVINGYFRGDYQRLQTYNEGYGRYTNPSIRARKFNVEKALEAFARAGFTERGRDGILRNDEGRRLSFKLTFDDSDWKRFLPLLIGSAKRAGLELVPEVLDSTTAFSKMQEKNHEIIMSAWNISGRYPRYWESWHKENAYTKPGVRKRQTNNITCSADDEASQKIDIYRETMDEDKLEKLSHELSQYIHDEAAFVPAFVRSWYRVAFWRWIKWPEGFDHPPSEGPGTFALYWIDEDTREETRKALAEGRSFEPVSDVYDQYRKD